MSAYYILSSKKLNLINMLLVKLVLLVFSIEVCAFSITSIYLIQFIMEQNCLNL